MISSVLRSSSYFKSTILGYESWSGDSPFPRLFTLIISEYVPLIIRARWILTGETAGTAAWVAFPLWQHSPKRQVSMIDFLIGLFQDFYRLTSCHSSTQTRWSFFSWNGWQASNFSLLLYLTLARLAKLNDLCKAEVDGLLIADGTTTSTISRSCVALDNQLGHKGRLKGEGLLAVVIEGLGCELSSIAAAYRLRLEWLLCKDICVDQRGILALLDAGDYLWLWASLKCNGA